MAKSVAKTLLAELTAAGLSETFTQFPFNQRIAHTPTPNIGIYYYDTKIQFFLVKNIFLAEKVINSLRTNQKKAFGFHNPKAPIQFSWQKKD